MNNTELTALIQRVKELDEKATPGPWGTEETRQTAWIGPMRTNGDGKVSKVICGLPINDEMKPEYSARNLADSRLIAEYRTAAPQLAAECERKEGDEPSAHSQTVPAAPTGPAAAATPRTDAAAFSIRGMSGDSGFNEPPKDFVSSDFARQLERELAELADEKARFATWIESHNETVKANVARENALRAELAEARKAIGKKTHE